MLIKPLISQLLTESLPDDTARTVLLELSPERVDAESFTELVEEISSTAVPEYTQLSQFSEVSIDCCGTGGSGLPRFNTSTAVAFVLAAAGVKVAKFGNRAAGGRSGSFDVLDHLGIPAHISANGAARLLDECNLAFIFAPQVYPALARLAPLRRSLGKSTVLNFVGPLLNPVHPAHRLVGVSDADMQSMMSHALKHNDKLAIAALVRSHCGLDEICPGAACDLRIVSRKTITIDLDDLQSRLSGNGSCCHAADVKVPSPEENARTMIALFNGTDTLSNAYELVCRNAAASLVISGRASTPESGLQLAQELLASGAVKEQLDKVRGKYAEQA